MALESRSVISVSGEEHSRPREQQMLGFGGGRTESSMWGTRWWRVVVAGGAE